MALGLGLSPFLPVSGGLLRLLLAAVLVTFLVGGRGRSTPVGIVGIMLALTLVGLSVGNLRLERIDRKALDPVMANAGEVSLAGFVEAEPSRSRGMIRFRFSTGLGRLMVEAADPGAGKLPGQGDGVAVTGAVGPPPDWYRPTMERHGLKALFRARSLASTSAHRGGLNGVVDRMRSRAERSLIRGMPDRESALARGFVLGQDAAIDARTTADFRAAGLSHLLAVSGQNVVLLGLLAWPVLALLGAGPQARRLWTVLLILIYVPLAGGGASIQRAGVMGIAVLAAAGAGRASSRLWVLSLAAAITLGLDPRACLDPGWQLSFAAVIGIALFAGPLKARLEGLTGSSGWQRVLAEGLAVTLAASIITAPLIAFHFGRLPVGTVAANLAVLPAVAPAMWLGMISAAVGQIWSGLALPFNLISSVFLAMIAQVAAWFGRPGWAEAGVEAGPVGLVAMTLGVLAGGFLLIRLWRPPSEDRNRRGTGRRRLVAAFILLGGLLLVVFGPWIGSGRRSLPAPPEHGVRIEFLDVGQGDAILIRPDGSLPLLIDGGPPGGDLRGALDSAGIDHLSAALLTHPDLDHFGGLFELFPGVETDRLLFDRVPGRLLAAARSVGTQPIQVRQGARLNPGAGVSLDLLWPPPTSGPAGQDEDPNLRSVVALFRWRDFRVYLSGDGEAEAVPVDPGPLDLLKVAHHGSADTGLPSLLARDRPRIAVIQVGGDNRYGHPTAETLLSLRNAGTRIFRTDQDGTVSLVLSDAGYRIETGR